MKVKQLELNLWDVISTARQTPEDANLSMMFKLLDLTLIDLDTRSQLRIAGEAVCQIADLFCNRSNFLFEELHSRAVKGEPIMADDAFDRGSIGVAGRSNMINGSMLFIAGVSGIEDLRG